METTDYLPLLSRSLPLLLKGLAMTVQIFASAVCVSLVLGTLCGIFTCKQLKVSYLSKAIEGWTFVLRAIPFYVQLLIVYFVLPHLLGIDLSPFAASVMALGMCSSGYVAQIVRRGIDLIPSSQWEAAFTLGSCPVKSLRYVILPQVGRQILPMLNNELESLLKSTSIVSSIGMLELTRMGMNIVSREMEPIAIYLTIALFYMGMSMGLAALLRVVQKKAHRV